MPSYCAVMSRNRYAKSLLGQNGTTEPSYMEDCRKSFIMTLHVDFSLFSQLKSLGRLHFFLPVGWGGTPFSYLAIEPVLKVFN